MILLRAIFLESLTAVARTSVKNVAIVFATTSTSLKKNGSCNPSVRP